MDTHDAPRVAALLRSARDRIEADDAALLLAHAIGRPHGWLYAHGDASVEPEAAERFERVVRRRSAGEPVAYLVGRRGFWRLDLQVTEDTLIPRPETERLVELALERIPVAGARVADLGTGSGAVALAIAMERPFARVVATDRSEAALRVARANADTHGLGRVHFRAGDWLEPLAGECFDVIVANPPYIALDDPHLARGDLRYEPASALASGLDGLDDIRRIIGDAPACLANGGWLLLEHGHEQGPAVRALLHEGGFIEVATARDLEGRDRVALGRIPAGR